MSALLLLAGCGPDPALVAEKDRLTSRVAELEAERTKLEKEADSLHAKVQTLESEMTRQKRLSALSSVGLSPDVDLPVIFETSLGDVHCVLWPGLAPLTVANFVGLAEGTRAWTDPVTEKTVKRRLYDGTIFHRVIPKFMIQGGDPLGTGRGGPGYTFEDETDNGEGFEGPGLLAMANRGPNTNGSQFFITDRSRPTHLDGKHTIFGKCADLDVVEAIATTPSERSRPTTDVVLRRVRIQR